MSQLPNFLRFSGYFLGIASVTALAGTSSTSYARTASVPKPPGGKIFRFRLGFEPRTLDWNQGDVPILITQNTMRGLYRVDEEGKVVPDLIAESATRDHGKTWTFKLKSDIKWSDGVVLNAQNFVDSFRRLLNPKTASSYAYFLFDIQNARAVNHGEKPPETLGAKALDALTLEVKLERETPFLPSILTHWVTYPIRADMISQWPDHWTNPKHMASLGAFQISELRAQLRIVLEPNPYAEKKPWLERVEGWMVGDDNTAVNLYDTAHLELATDPGQSASPEREDLIHRESPIEYFIGAGPGHPLAASRPGMLALSAALSRVELSKVLNSPERPTLDFCPPELWKQIGASPESSHPPQITLEGSVSTAQNFLKEAGFASGKDVPPITLRYFNRPAMKELAEWIQAQWKKNLGLHVELEGTDPKSYWATLEKKPSAFFLNSKGTHYPDPDTFFRLFSHDNPQNLGRWKDVDYDLWVEDAAHAATLEQRQALYMKAAKRLLTEKPALIPLYFKNTEYLLKPFVKDIKINPLTSVDLSSVHY